MRVTWARTGHEIAAVIAAALIMAPVMTVLITLAAAPSSALAQPAAETAPATKSEILADPLGRETPRGMMTGFLDAVGKENFEKAAQYLNLGKLSRYRAKTEGPELARNLQIILDKGARILPTAILSADAAGHENDGLEPGFEKMGAITVKGEIVDIIAEQIPGAQGQPIWVISSDTVAAIPALVKEVRDSRIDKILPESLVQTKWAGVPVGHWIAIVCTALLAFAIAWLALFVIVTAASRIWKNTEGGKKHIIRAFHVPAALYASVWIYGFASVYLGISVIARQLFSQAAIIVGWLSLIVFIWKLIDAFAEIGQRNMTKKGRYGIFSAMHFFRRSAKFIFLAVALIVTLDTLGVNVSAGLAALGIGGIALALGAQKTVENFVGSIMLIFDQPARIGDFCKVGDLSGTIEDIGMRSTRLRMPDRTLVTVPNGEFSSLRIENLSRRDRFFFRPVLRLRHDTGADQVRYLLVALRSLLYAHPRIISTSANVRFTGLKPDCLTIEVTAFVNTTSNDEFLEIQEDLLLRIMDILGEAGVRLALPAQTVYLSRDAAGDAEKQQEAARKVRDMVDKGELPLPKFDFEQITALKDTIDYPAPGSVTHEKSGKPDLSRG